MPAEKVLFVDRDGTLAEEPEDQQIDRIEKIRLLPDVIPSLRRLSEAGYRLVMVSNQDGLGTASFPEADFRRCQDFLLSLFASQGVRFSDIFICPHREQDGCDCRKPKAGLLRNFLRETELDRDRSGVVGDRDSDMALAVNLGLAGYRIEAAAGFDRSWPGIARTLLDGSRRAKVSRVTRETRISADVDLDVPGRVRISTGIGFLDHMLEQLARHGRFSLELDCNGDLHVDDHHSVEDCALVLGEALRKALGDKRGIGRYGFTLPMDEAHANVALDLSGRPVLVFDGELRAEQVGGLATEMVPHFFKSLADALGAAIHIDLRGDNTHHVTEAAFKGVGRALRPALAREGAELPTSKGVL